MSSDDSSDEETRVRVGNIPLSWYDDQPFLGYDVHGNTVIKVGEEDQLDKHIRKTEDPEYWKTITDELNAKKVKLTPEMIELIQKIRKGKTATQLIDPYDEFKIPLEQEVFGLHSDVMPPKRKFQPSKWERIKIGRLARAIEKGWLKPKKEKEQIQAWDLWGNNEDTDQQYFRPPKQSLPGHIESYNPPSEYLLSQEDEQKWLQMHPEDKETDFIPRKYKCLRQVPGYDNFIQERFERCMDLFLCPRIVRPKINIDPDSLIPELPDPETLKPFPDQLRMIYKGHDSRVSCFDFSKDGIWLVSGDTTGNMKIWEANTGKCVMNYNLGKKVYSVSWNPVLPLVAVASDKNIIIQHIEFIDDYTFTIPEQKAEEETEDSTGKKQVPLSQWINNDSNATIQLRHSVHKVQWHAKGDYLASFCKRESKSRQVIVHSLSRQISAKMISRQTKGLIRAISFHPKRALFFVATNKQILSYNLKTRLLAKKFKGLDLPKDIHIHSSGDYLMAACEDCRLQWYDYDLESTPYKTFKFHTSAIVTVHTSRNYPLMATGSLDKTIHLFHAQVFTDSITSPSIIPIKVIQCKKTPNLLQFYPLQPWLAVTQGKNIELYVSS